jgi:hypothetical protein
MPEEGICGQHKRLLFLGGAKALADFRAGRGQGFAVQAAE